MTAGVPELPAGTAVAREREQPPAARPLVANVLALLSGQLAIKVVSFVFSVVVIRYLGSEEYGRYAVCVAFGGLFTVLSDLGLATLTVKRVAGDRALAPFLGLNVLVMRLLLALVVVGLTTLIAWLVGYDDAIRLGIFIAALGLISYAFVGVADALAMGHERFRFSALLNVAVQVGTLALSAALVFSGVGFLGLLIAATVAALVVGVVALRRMHRAVPLSGPLRPASWPGLARAALPFAAITLALSVSYKADAVILSHFASAATIGAYAVAYNLVFTFTTLSHSINLALFPAMTRQQAAAPERAPVMFRQGFRSLLFISLPVAAFVSLESHAIVRLLYGEDLAEAGRLLAILIWALPLMFLSEFLGYVAIVVDRELVVARANWVASIGNVLVNLALIPVIGVTAAALTTVLTELLLVGQFLATLRHTGVVAQPLETYGRTLGIVALVAVLTLALQLTSVPLIAAGALAVAAYFLLAFATGTIRRGELAVLASMVRRN